MDVWGTEVGWKKNGVRIEGKGRQILVKMGGIRGGVWVRTNAQKSSKIYYFIQNLPPLQNGKCFQSAPNNCDYMVNPTPSPYILSESRDIKSIPAIPLYEYKELTQAGEKSCFCNFSRAYITIFRFSGINHLLFTYFHLFIQSPSPCYIVFISTSHHLVTIL